MSHVLAFGLRFRPTRRLLRRFCGWPRREDIMRLTRREFIAYIRALGIQQEAEAALARYRRSIDQANSGAGVRSSEAGADGRWSFVEVNDPKGQRFAAAGPDPHQQIRHVGAPRHPRTCTGS